MAAKQRFTKTGDALLELDQRTQQIFRPYADSRVVEALHPVSKLADHRSSGPCAPR